jgi:hypothetical protein
MAYLGTDASRQKRILRKRLVSLAQYGEVMWFALDFLGRDGSLLELWKVR